MTDIAAWRLHNQQLSHTVLHTPADVVAWLGAVQAQDYAGAKWALGLRLKGAYDQAVEQAFADGAILRTHVMRPTWHFVAAADIRWLLDLTAPRVHSVNAYMYRKLELDDALFARSNAAIGEALVGGKHVTRAELALVLSAAGITASGMRLGYIVHRAELDQVVCSGPRRGKQFTYALLDERAPQARLRPRDEALAELTRRYFTSHGPATLEDFAWWSGLTRADAQAGVAMLDTQLAAEVVGDKTYWFAPTAALAPVPDALLLPTYDEYTIAYKDHSAILDPQYSGQAQAMLLGGSIALGGQVLGSWRRTFERGGVALELAPFRPFTVPEQEAIAHAAQTLGTFLAMPIRIIL